jgi:two-component system NtrC family sensor kinase
MAVLSDFQSNQMARNMLPQGSALESVQPMTAESKARPRLLIAALILAAAVVAFAGLSFSRKAQTFQPIGFEAIDRGGSWEIQSVAGGPGALQVGDQILLINGQEYGQISNPEAHVRRHTTSEFVVVRNDELLTVSHTLPPLKIDFPYLILSLIGIAYLLIGVYTLLRDGRRPAFLFFLWCVTSAVLYIASPAPPYDWAGRTIYVLDEIARILVAPLTLHLFAVFPRPVAQDPRVSKLIPFFYMPSALLLALQVDLVLFDGRWLFAGNTAAALGLLDDLELYHLVAFSLAAVAVLWWRLRRISQPEPHRQATWIAIGMAGGYLPFLALYVLPATLGAHWHQGITAAAVLPLAFVPLTFAYAILRYKLWDIGVIVRDTMTLGLTVLVGVVGFSLANLVVNRLVPDDLAAARTLITFASGLAIAGLLVPTRNTIGSSLERLHYRGTFSKRRALARLGQEMLQEHSLGRLCASLVDDLQGALELDQVSLFLNHRNRLLPFRPQRDLPPDLQTNDFSAEFWDSEIESLTGVEFPTDELTAQQQLFTAGFRYAFPLQVRNQPIGILLSGYKQGELPLSSDDLELIRGVVNQASLALENAQLMERLSSQVEEVGRLQRYTQQIIESSPAAIAVVDSTGSLQSVNKAFGELVQGEPDVLVGQPFSRLLPVDELPESQQGPRELSFRDATGEVRHLQISVAPFEEDQNGELRVIVLQDVSQRVAMENALKEQERLASLGMLAAGVAHEVNTPITGISSYAQMLLAETPEGDPRRELLEKVEKQTFRAARIVNNLLDFARKPDGEQASVPLATLLNECLVLLKERLVSKNLHLDWKQPEEEIRVKGNVGELQQVFTNLIVNAIDALEDGGQLKVQLEADARWVWASVEDNGHGIPMEDLEKIFQPFYSTKLAKGGTGLGLSISYNIVHRHGGEIRVVSHSGEGSRFIVELPRVVEHAKGSS